MKTSQSQVHSADSERLTRSYVHGAFDTPLVGGTIGAQFDRMAALHHDREALVVRHQNVRWSYGELRRRVDDVAVGLIRLGLAPGERVGIWSQNRAEWVLMQFATAKAGLILVNINPAYRSSELEYALNKAGCRALVLAPRFKTSLYIEMLQELAPEIDRRAGERLRSARLPSLEIVIRLGDERTPGMLNFADIAAPASQSELHALQRLGEQLDFDDAVNIQFTSGTTGSPKGATLTHHNLLNNGFFVGEGMRLTAADRVCIPVPLYHCFGMVIGNLACVTHGCTMVYPGEAFDPLSVLETIEEERCTALHGVPTMFIGILDHPQFRSFDVTSLRTGMMAGSPCPVELMKRCVGDLHLAELTIGYGMTETSPISFQTGESDSLERRVSTVGRVHPHVEVKIVDSQGRITPRGRAGELMTRGYSVMLGYWGDDERTREAIDPAGWMRTGDLATIDEEGYCNIVGRVKDMVIRGGENIYPREIEEFLFRHPKVKDVQCVGVPDDKFGEELCAFIILRDGERGSAEEFRDHCKGELAYYKVPRYVRFVDSFPMTVTGKVLKYMLRERISGELQVREQLTA